MSGEKTFSDDFDAEEAMEETMKMLEVYRSFAEETLSGSESTVITITSKPCFSETEFSFERRERMG